ncbi:hypothetical protein [Numidum massiliense]|uniref:hypothetical protein n=1 Tax=Numidum massiliense TaxID=1522315 RepID=UPI0006D558FC|nr:hypothetical protein [Numidum massiliense]
MATNYPFLDPDFQQYMKVHRPIGEILGKEREEIQTLSSDAKAEDETNQKTVLQMYLIEIMLWNMGEEVRFFLGGDYSEAVGNQMLQLRRDVFEANSMWESFRKTFK